MRVHPLDPFGAFNSPLVEVGLVVVILLTMFAIGPRRLSSWIDRFDRAGDRRPRVAIRVTAILGLALSALFATYILRCFPNSADEYGYLFLADTLGAGRFWNETHPLQEFFSFVHIGERDGRWVSRFLPGWSLLLAAARAVRFPGCLVNPILGALCLIVFHQLARELRGGRVARIATVVVAGSGFFLFTSASWRSHTLTLLLLLGLAWCLLRLSTLDAETRGGRLPFTVVGLLAGGCLGGALITRPFTALLVAAPMLIWFVVAHPRRDLLRLLFVGLGALPAIGFLLYYNLRTTGSPWTLVTTWVDPEEGLGFVKGHTPWIALEQFARRLLLFLEWTAPTLLPLYLWSLLRGGRGSVWRRADLLPWLALTLPLLAVGHLFYFAFGGTQYGPRFWFEAYPFVALIAVDFACGSGIQHSPRRAGQARLALLAGLVFAVFSLPFQAARLQQVVDERLDLERQVEAAGLTRAVVLVGAPTGRLWPMGVGDLLRNGIRIDPEADVLFARDLGEATPKLLRAFPERRFLRYVRAPDEAAGRLEPVQ